MFRLKKNVNWQSSSGEPLLNGDPDGNISKHNERLLSETMIHDGDIM
jgi:hypothetical protein